jgi:23S rRNA (uracil1939-C5)-methyltransferase
MRRIDSSSKSISQNGSTDRHDPQERPAIGQILELTIEDLLTNGQGVGRAGGLVVFVWGPLPGERVTVAVTEVKARYAVAELVARLDTSPERVTPFCDFFGRCGGCQVQHLSYPAQLAWKRSVVKAALERIGSLAVPVVEETIGMDEPRAYRNKMSLVVERRGGDIEVGFYQARTHEIVPITACPILELPLQEDIARLRALISEPAGRGLFRGVKHIVIRRARQGGGGVAALTTKEASPTVARGAGWFRERFANLAGVTNSFDLASENAVLGRRSRVVSGVDRMVEELDGLRFRVSVHSFFQVNSRMVERIFAALRERIRPEMRILDLYSGAGTFAVLFAALGARVVGYEESASAVEEARENAALNGVGERARFVVGRVEAMLRTKPGSAALANSEVVFLDPPRRGSDDATLRALAKSGVAEIWYLSCNPATLARDCAVLAKAGFAIERVQPFDMFPQTGHVEVLATLKRESHRSTQDARIPAP